MCGHVCTFADVLLFTLEQCNQRLVFLKGYTMPCLSHICPLPRCSISSFIFHSKSIQIRSKRLAVHVQNFPLSFHICNHMWGRAGNYFFFLSFQMFSCSFPPKKTKTFQSISQHHERRKGKRKNPPLDWWGLWGKKLICEGYLHPSLTLLFHSS